MNSWRNNNARGCRRRNSQRENRCFRAIHKHCEIDDLSRKHKRTVNSEPRERAVSELNGTLCMRKAGNADHDQEDENLYEQMQHELVFLPFSASCQTKSLKPKS